MPLGESCHHHHLERSFWERRRMEEKTEEKKEEKKEEKNFGFHNDPRNQPNPDPRQNAASFCWILMTALGKKGEGREARPRKNRGEEEKRREEKSNKKKKKKKEKRKKKKERSRDWIAKKS